MVERQRTVRERFLAVRAATQRLCAPLVPSDFEAQSMTACSPTKWHLAHTSWFFETFVLSRFAREYAPRDPRYGYLFNSYYVTIGERQQRSERGLLTRPTLPEVQSYVAQVTERVQQLMSLEPSPDLLDWIELGCHHEQQHQELILTDILHLFSRNRLEPAYVPEASEIQRIETKPRSDWFEVPEGLYEVGHAAAGFAFDNEQPRHKVYLPAYRLATRLVTNGEFIEFIEDGGYQRPDLWLDAGYHAVCAERWTMPLYWRREDGGYTQFSLRGRRPLDRHEPVCHISYFEADAFARWAGARLPTEQEWEVAAEGRDVRGNFVETGRLRPARPLGNGALEQLFGDVWEWTRSGYQAYPGYRVPAGALGEYNGKFMCGQFVLRGGSCASPQSHIRATYRNFFHPADRWQFSGLRLAEDQ